MTLRERLDRWCQRRADRRVGQMRARMNAAHARADRLRLQLQKAESQRATAAAQAADCAARIGRVRDALESGEDPERVLDLVAEAVREGRQHA